MINHKSVIFFALAAFAIGSLPGDGVEEMTVRELLTCNEEGRRVRLCGTVDDAFAEERVVGKPVLVLKAGGERIPAICTTGVLSIESLLGAEVEISGVFHSRGEGKRSLFGRHVGVDEREAIRILRPPPPDYPFSAPLLDGCFGLPPQEIAALDRRRVEGMVMATWESSKMALRTDGGRTVLIGLANGALPTVGQHISAVGFPEPETVNINLRRSVWRPATGPANSPEEPVDITLDALFDAGPGDDCSAYERYHGKAIRLTGTIDGVRGDDRDRGTFALRANGFGVTVDATEVPGALTGLANGARVTATCVCVFLAGTWSPNYIFPRYRSPFLVPRSPSDIVIVSRPPWWTAGRLRTLVLILFVALIVTALWILALHRLAERRGRELSKETIAHAESDLKVYERTRLAVELHDALVQNLAGVSLEIAAADKVADEDLQTLHHHLGLASRTLKSCRAELRNCLWDLRNSSLEESDMNTAILNTLAPHVGTAKLSVRFDVPRDRISDNTAHAILRIVRELASNAIHHGGARTIRVAGATEGERLLFSVRDDGCGFDPGAAPGFAEGHYGLQGIRERVDAFGGEFTLESEPGHGVKATVSLRVPKENGT